MDPEGSLLVKATYAGNLILSWARYHLPFTVISWGPPKFLTEDPSSSLNPGTGVDSHGPYSLCDFGTWGGTRGRQNALSFKRLLKADVTEETRVKHSLNF